MTDTQRLQIKLCDTLSDFYAEDDQYSKSTTKKVFAGFTSSSDGQVAPGIAQNKKYLLPQWKASPVSKPDPGMNLLVTPQQILWSCGAMPILFYKGDAAMDDTYQNMEADIDELLSVLEPTSRPQAIYFTSFDKLARSMPDIDMIYMYPCDDLDNLIHRKLDPADVYMLQAKTTLALSGIPTPQTKIIRFGQSKESQHKTMRETLDTLHRRKLPFVLKTNYGAGSRGTYIVQHSKERSQLIADIAVRLPRDLLKLSEVNEALRPCDLILQEMLPPGGPSYNINFYVYSSGDVRFSSCTEQLFTDTGIWDGGIIEYSRQAEFHNQFQEVMSQAGAFLHSKGYSGPAGIDVVLNEHGDPLVVDLNARVTSSFQLGCLRPHFVDSLACNAAAVLLNLEFPGDRHTFQNAFKVELASGSFIITACRTVLATRTTLLCLVVGAEDRDVLEDDCEHIRETVRQLWH